MTRAVVLAVVLAASACGGTHRAAVRPSMSTDAHDPTARTGGSRVGLSTTPKISRRLQKQIAFLIHSRGRPFVRRVEVYGPTTRLALVRASSGSWVSVSARERKAPFYLIVLYGKFVCGSCSVPPGAKAPRGTVETLVWSPVSGGTDFGLSDRLPPAVSRLHRLGVIQIT